MTSISHIYISKPLNSWLLISFYFIFHTCTVGGMAAIGVRASTKASNAQQTAHASLSSRVGVSGQGWLMHCLRELASSHKTTAASAEWTVSHHAPLTQSTGTLFRQRQSAWCLHRARLPPQDGETSSERPLGDRIPTSGDHHLAFGAPECLLERPGTETDP